MRGSADIRDSRISIRAAAMLPFSLLFMILALPMNVSGGDTPVAGVPGSKLKERRLPSRRCPFRSISARSNSSTSRWSQLRHRCRHRLGVLHRRPRPLPANGRGELSDQPLMPTAQWSRRARRDYKALCAARLLVHGFSASVTHVSNPRDKDLQRRERALWPG
jgi:hypothetical protein